MRVIGLSAILIAFAFARLNADAETEVDNLVGVMTAGLTEVDIPEFMSVFDKDMPGYEQLKSDVTALVDQAEVSSSVEPIKNEGNENKRTADLDWFLQVRSLVQDGPLVQRREVVHCELIKEKNRWKIVSISPIDFFAPANIGR